MAIRMKTCSFRVLLQLDRISGATFVWYLHSSWLAICLSFLKILNTVHHSTIKSTAISITWEGIRSLFLGKQKWQWAACLAGISALQGFLSLRVITMSKRSLGWKELRSWFNLCMQFHSESQSTLAAFVNAASVKFWFQKNQRCS